MSKRSDCKQWTKGLHKHSKENWVRDDGEAYRLRVWTKLPPTEKQAECLKRNGLTAKNKYEASEIISRLKEKSKRDNNPFSQTTYERLVLEPELVADMNYEAKQIDTWDIP